MINEKGLVERFLRYVQVDTQSDENATSFPSTDKQLNLSRMLVEELKEMGIKDVELDQYGYVMATIPANISKKVPTIGFLSHVDTSPDSSGKDVKPRIVENYDGKTIVLNKAKGIELSPKDFPELNLYKGQSLIVTDGNTLLGADDKAGVAEIMTAADYIMTHPEFEHGNIRIGFTVDEEIGRGVDHFDVKKFNADFAYTLDGGTIGEMEYENFNAAGAKIKIQGRNIHPGYAKNKMVNALLVAMELNSILPAHERPEHTEHYDGFYHLMKMEGDVDQASMQYIIRDHHRDKFEERKKHLAHVIEFLNQKHGEKTITMELKDQYYNMRQQIEPVYHVVETAVEAMKAVGVKPNVKPIRGGTDGARLSYMGLPCPNIFAGGENFHGRHEYVPIPSMVKATEVILKVIELYAKK